MKTLLSQILDLLIPRDPKVRVLESLSASALGEKIKRAPDFDFPTDKIKAIFSYQEEFCQQAIWEIKYRANKTLIHRFSVILYDYILEELAELRTLGGFHDLVLIPTPSSRNSVRQKGFNHCELIARELQRLDKERGQNNFILITDILIKKINTGHQSKTHGRQERLKNLKNTFIVNERGLKKNKLSLADCSVILIDDVITTGATMNESFRALREAGAKKIVGYALAH